MSVVTRNRMYNASNPCQGQAKRVLCVCSAGLLRSPTAAVVLSQEPFSFNTRAAGLVKDYALIPVDEVLLEWADEVVCMTDDQAADLREKTNKPIKCLNIGDSYNYRDPALVALIADAYHNPMDWGDPL